MTRTDKLTLITIVTIALAIVAWLLWKRYNAGTAAPATAGANNTPTGFPITNQTQFGQQSPFQISFQPINVGIPVPSYNYNGGQQEYMPLFGFVGYSQYATA